MNKFESISLSAAVAVLSMGMATNTLAAHDRWEGAGQGRLQVWFGCRSAAPRNNPTLFDEVSQLARERAVGVALAVTVGLRTAVGVRLAVGVPVAVAVGVAVGEEVTDEVAADEAGASGDQCRPQVLSPSRTARARWNAPKRSS